MADLQQEMKHIEDERLLVRSDIEKINKKLENLTGTNPSSEEQLEAFHSLIKEQLTKSRIVDITVTPLSKVPRFMRPTICSKRKSGTGHQTSEGRDDTVLTRRRRPTSHRAESVSFPVKDHSEYNSDRSISRSSCLAELNMKISADNATECSQDTSETDFKSNGLQEQERTPGSLISQKVGISHIQKNSSRQVNKINHIKFSKVDNWLHLQKSESTLSSCSQRTKRVLAVPIPERKHKTNVQSKADEKVQDYVYTKQEVVNHDKLNNHATTGAVGKPISEVVIEKPLKMLRDLFNEDSRSDVTTPLQTTGGETTIQVQHSVDGSLTGDSENDTSSPPDECSPRLEECEDGNGVNAMSTTQAPEGKIQSSDCFLLKNSGCSECYPSELYTTSVCSKRDSGVSFSMLELESCCQQAPTESNMEDSETQGFYSFQPSEKETRHGLLQLKSQRALFTNSENHEDLAVPFGKPEGKVQNTGKTSTSKLNISLMS
jgi:kinesin family protein C2/C3